MGASAKRWKNCGVKHCDRLAGKRLNIVFAGTPEFAAVALGGLLASVHRVLAVYTQPDRPAGRGRKLSASAVKALAIEHGVPVQQPATLKDPEAQRVLAALQPDVLVVVAYGLILPPAVLAIPRLGGLNIHASLLPRWRGAAPIQRAILAGDSETGITIMQMDAGLDTGAMLHVVRCPVAMDDSAQALHDRLAALGAGAVLATLEQLAAGPVSGQVQDATQASYAAKITKQEARIDWTRPAEQLARQVRAFNPWPVAFAELGADPLRIWQAHALLGDAGAAPGVVVEAGKAGIDVATGAGCLRLLQVQLPGAKPVSTADFLHAHNLVVAGFRFS